MQFSNILSLAVALVLAGLGTAAKFSNLFPAAYQPLIGLTIGIIGAVATQFVAPFLPGMIPARAGKILSRLFSSALGIFGVLGVSQAIPPNVQPWISFGSGLLAAFGSIVLPHEAAAEWMPDGAVRTKQAGFIDFRLMVGIVLFPFVVGLAIPACASLKNYCTDPAYPKHAEEGKCALLHDTIVCSEIAGKAGEADAAKILSALAGNGANWIADLVVIAEALGEVGAPWVACEVAALQRYFRSINGPHPPAAGVHPAMALLAADPVLAKMFDERCTRAIQYFSAGARLKQVGQPHLFGVAQ